MPGNIFGPAVRGVKGLWEQPLAQMFTLAAVTLSAFLAGLFLLMLHNLDAEIMRTRGEVAFQVYWKADAPLPEVRRQWSELKSFPGLRDIETYTPDAALKELAASLGGARNFRGTANPLPPTAALTLAASGDDPGWAKATLATLKKLPGVAEVHYNPLQAELAGSWLRASRSFAIPLVTLLLLVAGLIVGNTIKLAQLHRRDEVEILRLVGATQFYVELPLIIGGAVLGLAGGGLGLLMLKGFQFAVKDVLNTAPLFIAIDFIPLAHCATLAGALTFVGAASGWAAAKQ